MNNFIRSTVFIFALSPLLVRAGGDEVVLIYNSRVPESKAVAEHYAALRLVPEKQIYGFDLTTNEEMSRAEFRDSLQLPLAKKLEDAAFRWPRIENGVMRLSAAQLSALLEGGEWARMERREVIRPSATQ